MRKESVRITDKLKPYGISRPVRELQKGGGEGGDKIRWRWENYTWRKEEECIWYSGKSEEFVSKGDGWERLQGFPEKGHEIACKGSEEGEMQRDKSLVCTINLALESKKPVPFNRACMFTKRLGPSITFYVHMPVT